MKVLIRAPIEWHTFLYTGDRGVLYNEITPDTKCCDCAAPVGDIAIVRKFYDAQCKVTCGRHGWLFFEGEIEDESKVRFGGGMMIPKKGVVHEWGVARCALCSSVIEQYACTIEKYEDGHRGLCVSCTDQRYGDKYAAPDIDKDKDDMSIDKAIAFIMYTKNDAHTKRKRANDALDILDDINKFRKRAKTANLPMSVSVELSEEELLKTRDRCTQTLDRIESVFNNDNEPHMCPVCGDKKCNYAINCGHLYCGECASKLDTCALCRKKKKRLHLVYL